MCLNRRAVVNGTDRATYYFPQLRGAKRLDLVLPVSSLFKGRQQIRMLLYSRVRLPAVKAAAKRSLRSKGPGILLHDTYSRSYVRIGTPSTHKSLRAYRKRREVAIYAAIKRWWIFGPSQFRFYCRFKSIRKRGTTFKPDVNLIHSLACELTATW